MDFTTVAVAVCFFTLILWGYLADVMTPFVRNLCAIIPFVTALILAIIILVFLVPKMKGLFFALFALPWVMFFLAEAFPRSPERLAKRREEVTFLQDLLFEANAFVLMIELIVIKNFWNYF